MSRIAEVALSQTLREYTQGAAQDALGRLEIAEFLAPRVNVSSQRFRYWRYDDTNRFKIPQTKRALHGGATVVQTGGEEVTGQLEPHALDYPFDEAELDQEDVFVNMQEGADTVAQLAALAHEKAVIDLALSALGLGTDVNAAPNSGNDLVATINGKILDIAKAAKLGSLINIRVLFGPTAASRFMHHDKTRGYFPGWQGKRTGNAPLSAEEISGLLFGRPEVKITLSVVDTAADGLTPALNWTLDNSVIIYACAPSPTTRDPSFMKTFAHRNKYMTPGTYTWPDGRGVSAKFDWWVKPEVTNLSAGFRYNFNPS